MHLINQRFTTILQNLKTQKDILDKVLNLYKKQSKINVDVDKDYFFFRLSKHCITEDKPIIQGNQITQDDSDSDIEQYLGGGKRKSKRCKTKSKAKKRKTTKKLLL